MNNVRFSKFFSHLKIIALIPFPSKAIMKGLNLPRFNSLRYIKLSLK